MTKLTWIALISVGCSTEGSLGHSVASERRQQVALVPVTTTNKVDLLIVVDDSPSSLAFKPLLDASLPAFFDTLRGAPGGDPDFQIGVVTTDLGTSSSGDAMPGPGIGSGSGSCSETGGGALMVSGSQFSGSYITETNHAGTLSDAFESILSIGAGGCGFEQPLRAAQLALTRTENAGFLRDDANLALIVTSDEDDCSLASTSLLGPDPALGPLQSFRCTRFGVTCDDGGETSDAMNLVGPKTKCHANQTDGYLSDVVEMASSIRSLKGDPRRIFFGALAVPADNVEVEFQTPPGGGAALPALSHSCNSGGAYLDPAVRITEMASLFDRSRVVNPCSGDLAQPMRDLARDVRGLLGDGCLTRDIEQPADCRAYDTHLVGAETELDACNGSLDHDCFEITADASCGGQGLRVVVNRIAPPAADTMVSLRCKL